MPQLLKKCTFYLQTYRCGISNDTLIAQKEPGNIRPYHDLTNEIQRMWNKLASIFFIIIGALEIVIIKTDD